nr:ClpX C4-type zinc finger protein [Rahnella sp. ChDrAdgB13]
MEDKKPLLRCSFCERTQHQVKKLIAGPYAYICERCVVKCVEVLADLHLDREEDEEEEKSDGTN